MRQLGLRSSYESAFRGVNGMAALGKTLSLVGGSVWILFRQTSWGPWSTARGEPGPAVLPAHRGTLQQRGFGKGSGASLS